MLKKDANIRICRLPEKQGCDDALRECSDFSNGNAVAVKQIRRIEPNGRRNTWYVLPILTSGILNMQSTSSWYCSHYDIER